MEFNPLYLYALKRLTSWKKSVLESFDTIVTLALSITTGKKILPDVEVLLKMFERDRFQPCPRRTSIVFPYFAQHFTHQFFKTDEKKHLPHQWGDHSVSKAVNKQNRKASRAHISPGMVMLDSKRSLLSSRRHCRTV